MKRRKTSTTITHLWGLIFDALLLCHLADCAFVPPRYSLKGEKKKIPLAAAKPAESPRKVGLSIDKVGKKEELRMEKQRASPAVDMP